MLKATTKISSPMFKVLFTPELEYLAELFKRNNFELRMAGGPVRDLLMGKAPSDIDFASTATPSEMKEVFERENVRMLHKRGEEHGTITCRINEKENFEITTLRIDVVCDGRRAEVKFTTDWSLDAYRRDLTINSLFLGLDGTVYDYTGGIEDIKNRRITFVGNPIGRIQEDYLRILRYFRFYGRFALSAYAHEKENLDAIIKCRDGLKGISGERLWTELHKILVDRFAAEVIDVMLGECGLAPFIGLAEASPTNFNEFQRVAANNLRSDSSGKLDCQPSTMLAALLNSTDELDDVRARLKFSNADYGIAKFILEKRDKAVEHSDDSKYFRNLFADLIFEGGAERTDLWKTYCMELMKYINAKKCLQEFQQMQTVDRFPVNGVLLMEAGVPKGPRVRATMIYLYEMWKKRDFKLSAEELLQFVSDEEEISRVEANLTSRGPQGPAKKKRKQN